VKILHVTRQFFPSIGGIQKVVKSLCEHLTEYGCESDVLTLNRLWSVQGELPAQETLGQIHIRRVPFFGGRRFFVAAGVLRAAQDCDLLHVHGIDFFSDYLALCRFVHGKPVVVSTYGGYFHTSWGRMVKELYFHSVTRLALSNSSRVICISEHDQELFRRIVPADKLCIIRHAVDDSLLSLDKDVEPGLLVCVGRIARNKRIDHLIRAMPLILQSILAARLHVVGRESGTLLGSLTKLAQSLGVQEAVSFAGEVSDAKLRQYLARAHVFVMASEYESFGVALLEAMAAGNVVVANRLDTFQEFVRDGENGFLVDFADAYCGAQTIVKALHLGRADREKIGHKARQTAVLWSWPNITVRYMSVYEKAMSRECATW